METIHQIIKRKTKFITISFAIHADGAFLNGAGLDTRGENRNVSTVKSYWRNKNQIPYVSAQAWRRWLRNTAVEEANWEQSIIEPVMLSDKETTNKIAGKLDPINYPEDDAFGYMFTVAKKKKDEKIVRRLPEIQLVRNSTIKSSILRGIPNLTAITTDQGFVHLKEGTPLPYSTEFYSSELTASLAFEIYRLGSFVNIVNGRNEIDPYLVENTKELDIHQHPTINNAKIYTRKNLEEYQNSIACEIINALSKLRGGSKLAQFGIDISPKFLILTGMRVGGMIFDNLIISENGKPYLNIKALKEILEDFKDQITTKIYVGIREGYFSNQDEIRTMQNETDLDIIHGSPIAIVKQFSVDLK